KYMDSFQFQSFNEVLDLIESDTNTNVEINPYYYDDLDLYYDDELIASIICYRLNRPSLAINIHPKSDHWYSTVLFNYDTIDFIELYE
ncbi:9116_t:CDS:1, partial [Gigaspora rosea]